MAVNSIPSSSAVAALKAQQENNDRVEKNTGNDGDKDDAVKAQTVRPTTNSNGETLGTVINTKA